MSPNDIAGYIAGWWGATPEGLFLPLATNDKNQIIVNQEARNKAAEAKAIAWLDTAIAVCLAESGGNPSAKNASGASGLWQIMMPLHADMVKEAAVAVKADGGVKGTLDVFNPAVNTRVAGKLYAAKGWQPWSAYNSGAYKKHLGHGKAAWVFLNSTENRQRLWEKYKANLIETQNFRDVAELGAYPLTMLDRIANLGVQFGLPIGLFLVGLVVIVVGLMIVTKTKPTDIVPAGKIAKAVT